MGDRPSWHIYFLNIAKAVAARGECTRAQHGAVIVDAHNRIISTGYNGTPPGDKRSCFRGDCPRAADPTVVANKGSYENCIAIHAEANAVANATRDMRGGRIFIARADGTAAMPCDMCAKLCAAAGLTVVL